MADLRIMALTVQQPWAYAILTGEKTVENRSWSTGYRGPLAIHAAARDDAAGHRDYRIIDLLARRGAHEDGVAYNHGAVIAVARLVDICSATTPGHELRSHRVCECGPWRTPGQHHWQLADVRPLDEPVRARGRLGLWPITLPAGVLEVTGG